jgi:glyoxylase-like metal-dependent hydrolase (beta-lactamase superfamily II)
MKRFERTPSRPQDGWSRRRLIRAGLQAVPVLGTASLGSAFWPAIATAQKITQDILTTDLGGIVLLQGGGSNVVALAGDEGALMIDGGLAENADAVLRSALVATGNDRVQRLINTHWHPEQTGANQLVGESGGVIFAHEKTQMYLSNTIHYGLIDGPLEPLPAIARPTEVTRGDGSLQFAGRQVDYGYLPQAHTDGDLFVYFPNFNVLVAGGVVSGEEWPQLDYRNGAWYGGRVRALQRLAELVDADTRVVPAHGPLITGRDIVRVRDIYLDLFETMIGYMNMGLGAEDVVERNPLEAYEAEFGDPSAFLDGAYRSMQIAYVPD